MQRVSKFINSLDNVNSVSFDLKHHIHQEMLTLYSSIHAAICRPYSWHVFRRPRAGMSQDISIPIQPTCYGNHIYCISIRTRQEIYGEIYPFAWRSSRGQSQKELLKAKGYIWLYIPSWVLILTQYIILTIIRLMITSLFSLTITPYTP